MLEQYKIHGILGKGGFGVVFAAEQKSDGLAVAIKEIYKPLIENYSDDGRLPLEIVLMQQVVDLPGVIKILDFFDTDKHFYIVMERYNCEDLFELITKREFLPEDLAKNIFSQVVNIVIQCHIKKVLHRDIKEENILIDPINNQVKLIDFGCGTHLHDGIFTEFDGTTLYSPPEWIMHNYYKADGLTVWSLGILLYSMLCGNVPFWTEQQIINAKLIWPSNIKLTPESKNIVQMCLNTDPEQRISLQELLIHPWLSSAVPVPVNNLQLPIPNLISMSKNNSLLPMLKGTHVHFNLTLTVKYEPDITQDKSLEETNYMQRKSDAIRFERLLSPILSLKHRKTIWEKINT